VTGLGIVTPFGCDIEVFWDALQAGRSFISTISRIDTSDFPVHIGGQVTDVAPTLISFRAAHSSQ
jgi:3-oxoacyl-[acyl-carrier-protein] synthase II